MAYDVHLKSDPSTMPLKSAIMILLHKKKKMAFVGFTTNARGRAAVLASIIRHAKDREHDHLRGMPSGDIREFELLAVNLGLEKRKGDATVERYQAKFEKAGYTLFGGARSAIPKVVLDGRRMSIVEAMAQSKTKTGYQTVYRRIQRGWPVKQALDLVDRV